MGGAINWLGLAIKKKSTVNWKQWKWKPEMENGNRKWKMEMEAVKT